MPGGIVTTSGCCARILTQPVNRRYSRKCQPAVKLNHVSIGVLSSLGISGRYLALAGSDSRISCAPRLAVSSSSSCAADESPAPEPSGSAWFVGDDDRLGWRSMLMLARQGCRLSADVVYLFLGRHAAHFPTHAVPGRSHEADSVKALVHGRHHSSLMNSSRDRPDCFRIASRVPGLRSGWSGTTVR